MKDEDTGILHVPLATTSDGIFWRGRFGLRMSERGRSVTISSCAVLADACYMYSLYSSTIIGRRGGTALSPTSSHPLAEATYADEPRENGAIPQVKGGWKQDDIVARGEIPSDLGS